MFGFEHESNGRDRDASRSYNRAFFTYRTQLFYDMPELKAGLSAWHFTRRCGNNKDIKDFLGNVEPFIEYQTNEGERGENSVFRLPARKGSNSDRFGVSADFEIPWAKVTPWDSFLGRE